MRLRLLACLTLAGAVLAGGALAAPTPADRKFEALYTSEWSWRQAELAHGDEGDSVPLPAYLPKVDAASQAKRLAYWQNVRSTLDAIPERELSPDERVNYEVYRDQI